MVCVVLIARFLSSMTLSYLGANRKSNNEELMTDGTCEEMDIKKCGVGAKAG